MNVGYWRLRNRLGSIVLSRAVIVIAYRQIVRVLVNVEADVIQAQWSDDQQSLE